MTESLPAGPSAPSGQNRKDGLSAFRQPAKNRNLLIGLTTACIIIEEQ
jgi:hypothetical protein